MIDIKKVNTPNKRYTTKVIPLAFDESMSYYQCICNIANHINNEVLPVVNDMEETVITLSNDFKDLQDYVNDNMLTKEVDDLTYYTKTSDLSSVALSGSYNDLTNKPTIPDVSNFITKDVNDLTNYTLTSNLSSVATTGSYNDLTNKPTIPDVSNFITKDVNDLTNYTLTSNLASVATTGSYNDLSNTPTIPTVPTNVSAFTNDSGYLTNTDYASSSTCGVIKVNNYYGTSITNTGALQGGVKTYSNYSDTNNTSKNALISKGTLENVITGKGLIDKDVNNLTNYTDTTTLTTLLAGKENVILSGSNSNGYYIKFDNGIMLEYGIVDLGSINYDSGYGAIYLGGAKNITLPLAFDNVNDIYSVNLSLVNIGGGVGGVSGAGYSRTSLDLYPWHATNAQLNTKVSFIVIGKWK